MGQGEWGQINDCALAGPVGAWIFVCRDALGDSGARILVPMTAGIYIHIPFCRSRCSYCDFATGIYQSQLAERYVSAIVKEIAEWGEVEQGSRVDTIYLGGGTPSMLSSLQVERILSAVYGRFEVSASSEITMEMNPGNLSCETLCDFKSLGINRASFGAQTFDDAELAKLGRSHTAAETRKTFRDLKKAGFQNINFDLIAGLPGQTLDGWNRNIEEALALRPEHLSFYLLEVHEGTPLAEHIKQGKQPKPDEDLAGEMYELMLERSGRAGYFHYEISNLCLPGFESRHNTKYWTAAPYYGFGCSAHSYDGKLRRWANERDVKRYVDQVEAGFPPATQSWQLSEHDMKAESVFLGLRLMKGISLRQYQEVFDIDVCETYRDDLDRFLAAGLIEIRGDLLRLTRAGALLSNEVFAAFV
jgi:oxygen-independent coproporphyrinogen-3 oxidase